MAKNVKKEKKQFHIRPWMVIVSVFIPVASIVFMTMDIKGQKNEKKRLEKEHNEIEEIIKTKSKKNKKETKNDKVEDKESDEES